MAILGSKLEDVYEEIKEEENTDNEEDYDVEEIKKPRRRRRNKTIKKKYKSSKNRNFNATRTRRNTLSKHLGNSKMPPLPQITKEPDEIKEDFTFGTFEDDDDDTDGDNGNFAPSSYENSYASNHSKITESYVNENSDYYNEGNQYNGDGNYIPNYTEMSGRQRKIDKKDHLMEKLNYMIHMLEEQQDESTSNVGEELILYMFLGVFVIFIVDSFSQSKSYER